MATTRLSQAAEVLAGLTVAGAAVVIPAESASAQTFHQFSNAEERSPYGGLYTLEATRHSAVPMSDIPSTGCSTYYAGSPVYQTQWIFITSDNANWFETGTGHQCNDTFRYHFWGFGYGGAWFPAGQANLASSDHGSHTYGIWRSDGYIWHWKVDGVERGTQNCGCAGQFMATGLESYASGADVGPTVHDDLKFAAAEGTVQNWANRDGSVVTPGGTMCGLWLSDVSWKNGENATC